MARKDWPLIEADYRVGQLSVREMETKYGVDDAQIVRHMKKKGITRDLAVQVRAATSASLIAQEVSKRSAEGLQTSADAVEIAAKANAGIILGHRQDIALLRSMVNALADKVRAMGILEQGDMDLLTALVECEDKAMTEKQATLVLKRIRETCNTPAQVGALKGLSEALSKLIALERQAFSLDETGKDRPRDLAATCTLDELKAALNG